MNRANLLHQIETLRRVQQLDSKQGHPHFDMNMWARGENWGKADPRECGTVACALGWEAMTFYANKRGLKLGDNNEPMLGKIYGTFAAAHYFDLNETTCNNLFMPYDYERENGSHREITPQDVIDRITLLLGIGERDYLYSIHLDDMDL